jgi:putative ABC transport system permease protein
MTRVQVVLTDALQGLRSGRGTLLLAFIVLTLAMTAGTVTFSVVDGVALRPLPYSSPEQLVGISSPGAKPGTVAPVSPQDYFSWADGTQAFQSLAASRPAPPLQLEVGGGGTEPLVTRRATANLFDMLGVRPVAGRLFGPEDERAGGPGVAILSHEVWARRFGADRSVIGRIVNFGHEPLQIVGVLPAGVWHPLELSPPDVYTVYVATGAERSNGRARSLSVVGRLRTNVTVEQARADVIRVSTVPIVVLPLQDQVAGAARQWLFLLLAAVALVLLIACVNVATLLLVRATARAQELAIREALGESRGMLGIGLVIEGLMLALSAGLTATVVSVGAVEAVKANLPAGLFTRVSTIAVDARVLSVSMAVAVLCGIVFASAPAWLAARCDLIGVMKAGGGPLIGGRRADRSLTAFLVAEVTVVCVLLVATTLVVRSFLLITTADLGFDRKNVVAINYERPRKDDREASRPLGDAVLRAELLARTKSVPGVVDAAISTNGSVPLSGSSVRYSLIVPGMGETQRDDALETRMVTPDYFRVMGMQLVDGRLFDARDRTGAPLVMVINDVAARRFFPDRNPLGQIVTFRGPTTIVGVLRGVHFNGPEADVGPEMYLPADQEVARGPIDFGELVMRTSGSSSEIAAAVRDAVRPTLGVEPGQARVVDDLFRRITAGRRFNAGVMVALGFIGIALGVIGVYGTMAFIVTRQFRDIGLRLALGASRSMILRSVLGSSLRCVGLGMAMGLSCAWAVSNAFRSFVFGIHPTEPSVYCQVAGFVALISLVAALVPAMRAARLDPSETLRRD